MAAKYDRIAADLRRRIQSGEFTQGQRLRSETDLMGDYRVSLNTLRRALDLLESEGLIEKRQGTGNFVREARHRIRRTTDRYQWEKDRTLLSDEERRATGAVEMDTGLPREEVAFSATYDSIEADESMARAFGVPAGERLLKRTYRTWKRSEKAPLGVGTTYLLHDLIAANPDLLDAKNEPWPGGTQHQLLTVGIELDRIVDEVSARPPTAEESEALDIGPGISVLEVRKISIDTLSRVVEIADLVWPGDRLQLVYSTPLRRWS